MQKYESKVWTIDFDLFEEINGYGKNISVNNQMPAVLYSLLTTWNHRWRWINWTSQLSRFCCGVSFLWFWWHTWWIGPGTVFRAKGWVLGKIYQSTQSSSFRYPFIFRELFSFLWFHCWKILFIYWSKGKCCWFANDTTPSLSISNNKQFF